MVLHRPVESAAVPGNLGTSIHMEDLPTSRELNANQEPLRTRRCLTWPGNPQIGVFCAAPRKRSRRTPKSSGCFSFFDWSIFYARRRLSRQFFRQFLSVFFPTQQPELNQTEPSKRGSDGGSKDLCSSVRKFRLGFSPIYVRQNADQNRTLKKRGKAS